MGLFGTSKARICMATSCKYKLVEKRSGSYIFQNLDNDIEVHCNNSNLNSSLDVTVRIRHYIGDSEEKATLFIPRRVNCLNGQYIEIQSLSDYKIMGNEDDRLKNGVLKGYTIKRGYGYTGSQEFISNNDLGIIKSDDGISHRTLAIVDCVIHLFIIDGWKCVVGVNINKDDPEDIVYINKNVDDILNYDEETTYFVRYTLGESQFAKSTCVDMPREVKSTKDYDLLGKIVTEKIGKDKEVNIVKFIPIEDVANLQD